MPLEGKDREGVLEGSAPGVGLAVPDPDTVELKLGLGLLVTLPVPVGVAVVELVGVPLGVPLTDTVEVRDKLPEVDSEAPRVSEEVGDWLTVLVTEGV